MPLFCLALIGFLLVGRHLSPGMIELDISLSSERFMRLEDKLAMAEVASEHAEAVWWFQKRFDNQVPGPAGLRRCETGNGRYGFAVFSKKGVIFRSVRDVRSSVDFR